MLFFIKIGLHMEKWDWVNERWLRERHFYSLSVNIILTRHRKIIYMYYLKHTLLKSEHKLHLLTFDNTHLNNMINSFLRCMASKCICQKLNSKTKLGSIAVKYSWFILSDIQTFKENKFTTGFIMSISWNSLPSRTFTFRFNFLYL